MALVLWKFEPARIHLPSIGFAVAVVPGLVVAWHRRANLPAADVALVAGATITVLAMTGPWFSMDKAIRFYLIALLPAIVAAAFAVLHITSAWLAALRFRLLSRNQIRPANAALSGRRPPARIWAARIQSARPGAAQCHATTAHPGWQPADVRTDPAGRLETHVNTD